MKDIGVIALKASLSIEEEMLNFDHDDSDVDGPWQAPTHRFGERPPCTMRIVDDIRKFLQSQKKVEVVKIVSFLKGKTPLKSIIF